MTTKLRANAVPVGKPQGTWDAFREFAAERRVFYRCRVSGATQWAAPDLAEHDAAGPPQWELLRNISVPVEPPQGAWTKYRSERTNRLFWHNSTTGDASWVEEP